MNKNDLILSILKMQEENKEKFFEVANKEDLQKLSRSDLILVYNATYTYIK